MNGCRYIANLVATDLFFGVVFGRLTAHDFSIFLDHEGLIGLKYAILDEIVRRGLAHMPTFKERLRYKTNGPIREALAMLTATGMVRRVESSVVLIPTIKGRLLLDLSRRLLFEWKCGNDWSAEVKSILAVLGELEPAFPSELNPRLLTDRFQRNLFHAEICGSMYGRHLLQGVDSNNPVFHSDFKWEPIFEEIAFLGASPQIFNDVRSLFFISEHKK